MAWRLAATAVVIVHFGFVGYVMFGGLLVRRRPATAAPHVAALAWAVAIVTVGLPCPLTWLENEAWRRAGEAGYRGGFVDRYLEDVLYPERYADLARVVVAFAVVASYAWLWQRRRASLRRTRGAASES